MILQSSHTRYRPRFSVAGCPSGLWDLVASWHDGLTAPLLNEVGNFFEACQSDSSAGFLDESCFVSN